MSLPALSLTFKQVRKGAVILALLCSLILLLQGIGLQKTFPDHMERTRLIASFQANPVFTFLYGENDRADTPVGYMMYRSGPVLAFIGSIWMLLFTTKVLRGQEEDGRLELLLSGPTTKRRTTIQIMLGIALGIVITVLIMSVSLVLISHLAGLELSLKSAIWTAVGFGSIFLCFAAVGALLSELLSSRRRAVMYGMATIFGLFILRGIGNALNGFYWFKDITPFGWLDQLRPMLNVQPGWILVSLAFILLCAAAASFLAGKRDYGSAFVTESDSARPHYAFLEGAFRFGARLSKGMLMGWALAGIVISLIVPAIAKSAADALQDSQSLSSAISQVIRSDSDLTAAFLSLGSLLVSVLLLAMIAAGMSTLRDEESRGQADNLLVRQTSKIRWLTGRGLLLLAAAAAICLVASITIWAMSRIQGIELEVWHLLIDNLTMLGPLAIFLGIGFVVFGILPKATSGVLYALLAWSFVGQILTSIITAGGLRDFIMHTSLLHYISLAPAAAPNWAQFWVLLIIGVGLVSVGAWAFQKRDIQTD